MKKIQNTKKALVLATGMLAAGTMLSQGATVVVNSYSYNPADHNFVGKDDSAATAQALTDGLGKAGAYTPTGMFWEPTHEGTIYGLVSDVGVKVQPSVTFDLGSTIALKDVTIHYGVRQASGIHAPISVSISIDGGAATTYTTGFDNTGNADNFGDIRSNTIDLTGLSGQNVTLEFLGNNAGSFTGLTEVEFSAVPEPSSTALIGLGGLALILRRRK